MISPAGFQLKWPCSVLHVAGGWDGVGPNCFLPASQVGQRERTQSNGKTIVSGCCSTLPTLTSPSAGGATAKKGSWRRKPGMGFVGTMQSKPEAASQNYHLKRTAFWENKAFRWNVIERRGAQGKGTKAADNLELGWGGGISLPARPGGNGPIQSKAICCRYGKGQEYVLLVHSALPSRNRKTCKVNHNSLLENPAWINTDGLQSKLLEERQQAQALPTSAAHSPASPDRRHYQSHELAFRPLGLHLEGMKNCAERWMGKKG